MSPPSLRRDHWRTTAVGLALLLLLFSTASPLLPLVVGVALDSRAAFGFMFSNLIRNLPLIALPVVYLLRPMRMRPAYWLLPALFLAWGAAPLFVAGWDLFFFPQEGDRFTAAGSIPLAALHLVMAGVLWAVRPAPDGGVEPPIEPQDPMDRPEGA